MGQTATANVMRSINRAAILDLIRRDDPIARSQVAKRLKISLPTVMRIVDDLSREDLVRTCGNSASTGGRPCTLLEFNGKAYAVVGVDLGGTDMFGMIADLSGTVQHEILVPLDEGSPDDRLASLFHLIQRLLDCPRPAGQKLRGIGIGAPGVTHSQEGVVVWAPSLGWRNLPLKSILTERFNLPAFVDNDVNLSALGELGFGAGQGMRNLVCLAVGTGMGAGIIINGMLHRGHNEAAGEIGYLLPAMTFLGRRYDQFGALETLASDTGVIERARQLLAQHQLPIPEAGLSTQRVFDAARRGEGWAQQVLSETVDYLSLAIADVSAVLDPEVVVVGGDIARYADLLIEPIKRRLDGVIPFVPKVVASSLKHRAVVMGAIMLVLNATMEYFVVERHM